MTQLPQDSAKIAAVDSDDSDDLNDLDDSNDELNITVLGSGTCVPSLRRSACSVFMTAGDAALLFDIGPGTMRRLLEIGTRIFDVTHIFLSHFHPDHTGELVPFLFATKYPDLTQRQAPLTLLGGKGLTAFLDGLSKVYGSWMELPRELFRVIEFGTEFNTESDAKFDTEFVTAEGGGCQFATFRVDTAPTVHNPESIAYRITASSGRSAVYSGDTDMSEALIRLAHQTDLLICEAALPDGMKVAKHLTPSLAGEIAVKASVKRLMLTHFYPPIDAVDVRAECRRTYAGPLLLAEDLMPVVW